MACSVYILATSVGEEKIRSVDCQYVLKELKTISQVQILSTFKSESMSALNLSFLSWGADFINKVQVRIRARVQGPDFTKILFFTFLFL